MARNGVDAAALRELSRLLALPPDQPNGASVALDLAVLVTLGQLVPADLLVFNDLAPRRRGMWAGSCSIPDDELPDDGYDDDELFFDLYWDSDCSYPDRSGDLSVTIGTDFCSLREWRRSPMYALLSQGLAFDREMMMPLPGPVGHSRRIRFIRLNGREFDDTDRAVAALVKPHLVAYLHVLDLASRGITPLTTRQRQLMSLVAQGFSNAQIARTLGITADTVRTHLQQIYARLGVASRGEAVAVVNAPGNAVSIDS